MNCLHKLINPSETETVYTIMHALIIGKRPTVGGQKPNGSINKDNAELNPEKWIRLVQDWQRWGRLVRETNVL